MLRLHHVALCPSDLDRSIEFYRDGIGLSVLSDFESTGAWKALFDVDTDRLRAVMLGHPERQEAGIVELVTWQGDVSLPPAAPPNTAHGFFLLSFFVDVEATAERLRDLGYETLVVDHTSRSGPMKMATVRGPDGVLVELLQILEGAPKGYAIDD